jgi:hypothetical protein
MDREKLREKARSFQMKENLRITLCARIQKFLKKSPKVAEQLADEIIRLIRTEGYSPDLSVSDNFICFYHTILKNFVYNY